MTEKISAMIAAIAIAFGSLLLHPAIASADIGTAFIAPASPTEVQVTLSHTGFTAYPFTDTATQGYLYRVCWRQLNEVALPCYTNLLNSNSQTFRIGGLTIGLPMKLLVWCYCRSDDWPHLKINRVVVDTTFTLTAMPAQTAAGPIVWVRHVATHKCLFLDPNGARARGWTCWGDPNMRFALEPFNGHKRLRSLHTGLCLDGGAIASSNAGAWSCSSMAAMLDLVDQGGGKVLIKMLYSRGTNPMFSTGPGGCLRAGSGEGEDIHKQACSAGLLFALDPA
jgi:hypothetical protein